MMNIQELIHHHTQRLISSQGGKGRFLNDVFRCSERWRWWARVMETKRIPKVKYPHIHFALDFNQNNPAYKNILDCLRPFEYDSRNA